MAKKMVSQKDRKIINKVVQAFDEASSARTSREDRWTQYYEMYRAFTEQDNSTRSNLNIPYVFAQVEAATPKLINNLFASKPYIGVMPLRGETMDKAKALEMLIDYQITHALQLPVIMLGVIKEAFIYGAAVSKITWRFETKMKKQLIPQMDEVGNVIGREQVEYPSISYDDPYIEHIDLFDFYLEPSATSIQKAKYCIHRVKRSPEYLKERMEEGLYTKVDMDLLLGGEEGNDFQQMRLENVGIGGNFEDKRVELLEYWENDRIIVVANRKFLLRDGENPYWHGKKPFVAVNLIPVMHEFYGIGFPEMMEHLQEELNTTRNQRRDNVSLVLNRMWKKLKMSEIDANQLVSKPGGIIEVDTMEDLLPMEMPDVTSNAYREEEVIKRDMDMVTGINDQSRGTDTSRKETATQASILANAAGERFKTAMMLAGQSINEIGQFMIDLNQQYMDRSRVVRITGIDGVDFAEISPEDIDGKYDVFPAGSSTEPRVTPEIKQAQFLQLYGTLANNPLIDQQKLLKTLLDVFGVKDASQYFIQQQPQMMDPMAAMMGGMAGGPIDPTGAGAAPSPI